MGKAGVFHWELRYIERNCTSESDLLQHVNIMNACCELKLWRAQSRFTFYLLKKVRIQGGTGSVPCASFLPLEKASEAHSGGSYDDTGKPAEGTKSTKRVQQRDTQQKATVVPQHTNSKHFGRMIYRWLHYTQRGWGQGACDALHWKEDIGSKRTRPKT
jgi:hypothetical protein